MQKIFTLTEQTGNGTGVPPTFGELLDDAEKNGMIPVLYFRGGADEGKRLLVRDCHTGYRAVKPDAKRGSTGRLDDRISTVGYTHIGWLKLD